MLAAGDFVSSEEAIVELKRGDAVALGHETDTIEITTTTTTTTQYLAIRKAGAAHAHILEQPQIAHLVRTREGKVGSALRTRRRSRACAEKPDVESALRPCSIDDSHQGARRRTDSSLDSERCFDIITCALRWSFGLMLARANKNQNRKMKKQLGQRRQRFEPSDVVRHAF